MKKNSRKLSDTEIASLKRVISKDALYKFMDGTSLFLRFKTKAAMFREILFCEYELLCVEANKAHEEDKLNKALSVWDKAKKVYKKYEALEDI